MIKRLADCSDTIKDIVRALLGCLAVSFIGVLIPAVLTALLFALIFTL